jgi:hypothetical protein
MLDAVGTLIWRIQPRSLLPPGPQGDHEWSRWNTRHAGKRAGVPHIRLKVGSQRRTLETHRVIFALTHGRWPDDQVDHKNRNHAANQIDNLREATNALNQQNRGLNRNNTSGFKGVSWDKRKRKWLAQIMVDGRTIRLGYFTDILDAIAARQEAERIHHPFHAQPRLDADIIALPPGLPAEDVEAWRAEVRGLWQLPPVGSPR